MRKHTNLETIGTPELVFPKEMSYSISTEESPRLGNQAKWPNKEKSQLCKKFIEHGFCPY